MSPQRLVVIGASSGGIEALRTIASALPADFAAPTCVVLHTAPQAPGIPGAGTVHHVAWASTMEDEEAWQQRVAAAGGRPTEIIDRFWFRSVYFREPSGVLYEIATKGPGFSTDEDLDHLG